MQKNLRPLGLGLTVLGALARVLPHPPNFAPVGSMSLYSGARLRGWQAFLLPLALMAITDPLVGGYSIATPFVYAAFLVNVWMGRRWLQSTENVGRIATVAAAASVQFFILSNLGSWLGYYPHSLSGLAACYVNAIPFYARTLAGDLLYTGLLFGLHAWLSRAVARSERVPATA